MRFPMSYRWSPYVIPNSRRVAQKANFYISVIDEASDFKFRKQLKFAKTHHRIPLEDKVGVSMG